MTFPLIAQPDNGEPQVFREEFHLGRSPAVGLQVNDPMASLVHARCWPQGGDWMIEDLGTVNWTLVNGERAWAPRPLGKGDVVTIGRTRITVVPA